MLLERADAAAVHCRPTPATARAAVARLVRCYTVLCLVLVPLGLALTRWSAAAPLRVADEAISDDLVAAREQGWNTATAVVTGSLDTLWAIVSAVVISAAIWVRWRSRMWTVLPLGLALELAVFLTVSSIVGRDRPIVSKLGTEPSTHSFPSGHAAAATVIWLGLVLVLREQRATRWVRLPVAAAAAIVPMAVAAGRVYRGMHHLSDVLAGVVMGAVVAVAVVRMLPTLPMRVVGPADVGPGAPER